MNELEEAVSIMYNRITQREYLNGMRECDNCSKNTQLFLYSKKTGRVLCADCILKTVREQMQK